MCGKNIMAYFIITLFARSYVRIGILLTWGKHLHNHIISLREEDWAFKTSLIPPSFIHWMIMGIENWFSCCLKILCFVSITHIVSLNGALSKRRLRVMCWTQCFVHNNYDWKFALSRDGTKWRPISSSIMTYIGPVITSTNW